MKTYREETIEIAEARAAEIAEKFKSEVVRLMNSGGVDPETASRGLLFGVAIQNVADGFAPSTPEQKRAHRNLSRF